MNSHLNTTQRDKMRELFRLHGGNRTRVVQAYAAAEQRGEVQRASDVHNLTADDYAARLFEDGIKKGWIHDRVRAG